MSEKPTYEELEQRVRLLEDAESKIVLVEKELAESREKVRHLVELNTNLEQLNEKNKEIEKRFRLIEENIIDVIWTLDINLKNTYTTPSILEQRGYTKEEVKEQSLNERISPGSLDYVLNLFAEKLELIDKSSEKGWDPVAFEMEQPCKDGSTVWTSSMVRLIKGLDNKLEGVLGTSHDITERVQAEKKLQESEKKYRLLADNIADVIWTMDMDLNLTYISPSLFQQRGYTVEEAINQTLEEVVSKDSHEKILDLYVKIMEKIKSGDPTAYNPIEFESEQCCKDGSFIWTSNYARILKGPNNQPESILGITHDITMRKRAEAEKEKAMKIAADNEKLALIGQIAGKIAHDFNNILGIIMGNTELSIEDCDNPELKKTLELILKQTLHGRNLTRNLVVFAKNQEPRQEFFTIGQKIDLVLILLKKDLNGIDVVRIDQVGVPELLADPGMIEHALVNLIQNSIHATSLVENPKIIIRTYMSDRNVSFEIEDNGCGIPEDHLVNIYSPSFTLKGSLDNIGSYKKDIKGTGYGLSNVKKYIKQHKGSISVKSEVGDGTIFTISLPVIKNELTIDEIAELHDDILCSNKNILLLEDEPDVSDVQYKVLTQSPFLHNVDIASKGQIAMDLFDNNNYDLISLDYMLSCDMNGMDVYHYIRKRDRTVPILFVSGNIEFLECIKGMKKEDPMVNHISKPCLNKEYVNSINRLLSL
jgi:PAS domain S-box-containing protein